jgi:hypothetical protein
VDTPSRLCFVAPLLCALALGCSFSPENNGNPPQLTGLGGFAGPQAPGGATGTVTGAGGAAATNGRCDWQDTAIPSCGGALYQGQGLPLDLYVMFDESGSMATMDDGVTMRIDAVRKALGQFLGDQSSAGMRVGIGYFGTQPLSCACTSCNANDYATPAVPLGLLPGSSGALTASLAAQAPTGETPTGAALRGACLYANKAKQTDRSIAILLVTDGVPQAPLTSDAGGCNPTLADATAAASSCLTGGNPIRTYVLGVGPSLTNLNQIASSGGTGHAYLVESGGTAAVLAALNAIRKDAMIPCSLTVPSAPGGGTVDLDTVNVVYANDSCGYTTFVNVKTAAGCDAQRGGWYYEDPNRGGSIKLCDASCSAVGAPGGELRVSVGCSTIVVGAVIH